MCKMLVVLFMVKKAISSLYYTGDQIQDSGYMAPCDLCRYDN